MRQAVVIIHGIGEQLPMSTVRRFVESVVDPQPGGRTFYSKPDRISDTLELRRLTADRKSTGNNSTDFYELYWQHLMTGTTFAHLQAWLQKLLLRRPGSVPGRLKPLWWSMWLLIFATVVAVSAYTIRVGHLPVVEGVVALAVLYVLRHAIQPLLKYFAIKYVGDAARYLSPFPENVGIRHAIRSAGLDLLRGLHLDPLRRYERIVVVGHSLGSVIAYDVLTYLWQEMHSKIERRPERNGKPILEELHHAAESESDPSPIPQPALDDLTQWVDTLPRGSPDEPAQATLNSEYRRHQRAVCEEYRSTYAGQDKDLELCFPWRVTDLVTLGSPLTYAPFLLARNGKDFCEAKDQREFPTCPPRRNDQRDDDKSGGASGLLRRMLPGNTPPRRQVRILHHGALFACTRWTNLYFPGDIVGGPLAFTANPGDPKKRAELFGIGVRDVKLESPSARWTSHVKYWDAEETSAKQELRDALSLGSALTG